MEYTLQEAARVLDMDFKTLKRWIDRANVEPTVDPLDRRRQLLTQEQVDQIAKLYHRGTAQEDQIEALERRVADLEQDYAILRLGLISMAKQLDMTEFFPTHTAQSGSVTPPESAADS